MMHILTNKDNRYGSLNKLVEIMFRAFREDIFHLRVEEGRDIASKLIYTNAKATFAASERIGEQHQVSEIINKPFNVDPRTPMQPRFGANFSNEQVLVAKAIKEGRKYEEPPIEFRFGVLNGVGPEQLSQELRK